MLLALFLFAGVLVSFIIFRLVRRKPRPGAYGLQGVGAIIDRAISAYRRHIIPILLLSILCFFVGSSSWYNIPPLLVILQPLPTASLSLDTYLLLTAATMIVSMLGIGKTILACGAVNAILSEQRGQKVTFGCLIPRHRLGAVLGLALLLIIPSILSMLVGWLSGLFAVLWMAAPAAMIYERLGPWAAVKRSFALVVPRYGVLVGTIVPLWVTGWLVVGTPLFGGLWLLTATGLVDSTTSFVLIVAVWIISQICVAPLPAFGAACFYLSIGEQAGSIPGASELTPIREVEESSDALPARKLLGVAHPQEAHLLGVGFYIYA
jgi:hypothetical protein